jgi:predicted permease
MLESLRQDLRYTFRSLRQSPGFAAAAIASLGLGIGLSATLFTLVDTVLWRPLPAADPDRLVTVFTQTPDRSAYSTSSYLDAADLASSSKTLTQVAGHSLMFASVSQGDRPRLVMGEITTGGFFSLLGVRPALGRLLGPADDRPDALPAVVVSERFWRSRFAGASDVLDQTIKLRGVTYPIVGVVPASFTGLTPGFAADLWVAAARLADVEPVGWRDVTGPMPASGNLLEHRGFRWMVLKGRLAEGRSVAEARQELAVLGSNLAQAHVETSRGTTFNTLPATAVRLHPEIDRSLKPGGIGLLVLVSLVLVVACANVANMLLARATGRSREIGVRMALGAQRGRLVRQLLTESVTLGLGGGIAGVGVALVATRLLSSLELPLPLSLPLHFGVDLRVLGFAFALALATGVLFGLLPALSASKPSVVRDLKGEPPSARGRWRFGLRDLLVVGQIATTLVLLTAAALFSKSLRASLEADLGLDGKPVALATFALDDVRYDEPKARAFLDAALERLSARPDVEAVAFTGRVPLGLNVHLEGLFWDGMAPLPEGEEHTVDVTRVTPGYFATLAIPLKAGRLFTRADREGGERVAIVNQAFVDQFWPGQAPLGQRLATSADGPRYEVVGVVENYKVRTPGEAPRPMLHFAQDQRFASAGTLLVRGRGDAGPLVEALRRDLAAAEPDLVLLENRTFEQMVGITLLPARLGSWLLGGLGLLALLLAAIGLYGVIAYAVARRTQEIGLRIALGAEPRRVERWVLGQGLVRVGVAALVALPLVGLAGSLLSRAFYGLGSFELAPFVVALGLVAAVTVLANLVPARRAAALDPIVALKRN